MTDPAEDEASLPLAPPNTLLTLLDVPRALGAAAFFYALKPLMGLLPRGDGHGVLILPGFMTSDTATLPLRDTLGELGYAVAGWELGRNDHLTIERREALSRCLAEHEARTGGKVSLVGWSLGGLFARNLARRHPQRVRQVITLGSPLQGMTGIAGEGRDLPGAAADPELLAYVDAELGNREPPPVPTTAIYSRDDGVVAWRGALQREGRFSENVEVVSSHWGLVVNPMVTAVLADRLAQPEGAWKRFEPGPHHRLLLPTANAG